MKMQSIKKYLNQYRKFYAKKEFVPDFIASITLLTILSFGLLVSESILYLEPNIKKSLANYFTLITLSIIAYPFIVWAFNNFNVFNKSKDSFLANLIADVAPNIKDNLLNALEIEDELHLKKSPSNDLSMKAINNVLRQLEAFNYTTVNFYSYNKW